MLPIKRSGRFGLGGDKVGKTKTHVHTPAMTLKIAKDELNMVLFSFLLRHFLI